MRRFEDRVVLITGAASGIGRATVERIASEGGRVFCVDVQAEAVEDAAKHAAALGARAIRASATSRRGRRERERRPRVSRASAASTRSATSRASCASRTRTR